MTRAGLKFHWIQWIGHRVTRCWAEISLDTVDRTQSDSGLKFHWWIGHRVTRCWAEISLDTVDRTQSDSVLG